MDEGDEYVPQISQIDYGVMGAGPMVAPPPQTNMSMGHQMGSLASPPQHHQMGPSGSGASGGLTPMTNPYDHPQMQMLMPPGFIISELSVSLGHEYIRSHGRAAANGTSTPSATSSSSSEEASVEEG